MCYAFSVTFAPKYSAACGHLALQTTHDISPEGWFVRGFFGVISPPLAVAGE